MVGGQSQCIITQSLCLSRKDIMDLGAALEGNIVLFPFSFFCFDGERIISLYPTVLFEASS